MKKQGKIFYFGMSLFITFDNFLYLKFRTAQKISREIRNIFDKLKCLSAKQIKFIFEINII